jgi:hypothetical protein
MEFMMIQAADVRSIEDVRDLHAQICKFRTDAADGLAAVEMIIRRATDYLVEKQQFWQRAIRACEDAVFQAKQELKQRQYPGFDGRMPDCTVQEDNLKHEQGKLRYAQEKLEVVRRWMSRLPKSVSEAYESPARHLAATLEGQLPRGLAMLEKRIEALEAYIALIAPAGATVPTATSAQVAAAPDTATANDEVRSSSEAPDPAAATPEPQPAQEAKT